MMTRIASVLLCLGFVVAVRANEGTSAHSSTSTEPQGAEAVQAFQQAAQTPVSQPAPGLSTARSLAEINLGSPQSPDPDAPKSQEDKYAEDLSPTEKEEIANLLKYAQKSYDDEKLDSALIAYRQLLERHLSSSQERVVLLGFARTFRKKGDYTKAVAVYEKLLKSYSLDENAPEIYLELGRTQRAMGAYNTAISRFYSVINSTIKLPQNGAVKYRQLTKTAQFEIAETHFQAGNYAEASRFYAKLRLLDLAPVDRARAHFKSAYALFLSNDYLGTIGSMRNFLDQYPDDENVPEAHYVLTECYKNLQRPIEAMVEALDLLRIEKARTAKDPKRWAYWQRKTGNQIANALYEQGNTADALTIYMTLAELDDDNAWRLPVLYQIGLCHERLGQIDLAISEYKDILEKASPKGAAKQNELADLARMASWRLNQIDWQNKTEKNVQALLPHSTDQAYSAPAKNDALGNLTETPTSVR